MQNTQTINAFILARKGSKRLKNKNMLKLGFWSLLEHSELFVWKCDMKMGGIVISTDINYKKLFKGTIVNKRPKHLCGDKSTKEEVINYLLKKYPADYVVLLQPTSPIRKFADLKACIKLALKRKSNVISGYMNWAFVDGEFKKVFCPNGYFYVYKDVNNKKFIHYIMPKSECIDIDDRFDYQLAQKVYNASL